MQFDEFNLARQTKVGHLVPNADILESLWRAGQPPAAVVLNHCTNEAAKERHKRD